MSALLATMVPSRRRTFEERGLPCKVMVFGAGVTERWAKEIGADARGVDATDSEDSETLLNVA